MITSIMPVLMEWSVGEFLKTLKGNMSSWVAGIIGIIGVIMVGAGIYQVAKGLAAHGKAQISWPVAILLIVLGGLFISVSALNLFVDIGKGAQTTINNLGEGKVEDAVDKKNVFLPFF